MFQLHNVKNRTSLRDFRNFRTSQRHGTSLRDFRNFRTARPQKRNKSARRPQCSNFTTSETEQVCETSAIFDCTTSKTEQVCETSAMFELHNVRNGTSLRDVRNFRLHNLKNGTSLRDVRNVRTSQHQRRSNSARLPAKIFKNGKLSAELNVNAFCDFSFPSV